MYARKVCIYVRRQLNDTQRTSWTSPWMMTLCHATFSPSAVAMHIVRTKELRDTSHWSEQPFGLKFAPRNLSSKVGWAEHNCAWTSSSYAMRHALHTRVVQALHGGQCSSPPPPPGFPRGTVCYGEPRSQTPWKPALSGRGLWTRQGLPRSVPAKQQTHTCLILNTQALLKRDETRRGGGERV